MLMTWPTAPSGLFCDLHAVYKGLELLPNKITVFKRLVLHT